MRTLIFATTIRYLTPLFLIFSVYILFRGHNHPGGGFIGGLIGSIAFVFHVLAHGPERTAGTYFQLTFYHQSRQEHYSLPRHMWQLLQANTWNRVKQGSPSPWRYYMLRVRPAYMMATGLLVAATSGFAGLLAGLPYMTGFWLPFKLPLVGGLGTPLLFDTGVYLLVLGMILKMVFTMSKE
ncbi:MnhB domain-containing protein [Pontibacter mangrovi]|uniref:Cation:proton antiporter n=1 Tax=Pontibacter mangrovi TaxID=2589816 RepID=A0A501W7Q6_9BACT|nr:MnhB domain-containing protein [Pontibacter mangrovi]TPE45973.1 cation:proton antiporter [Pontibacter mangrovi]